MRRSVVKTTPSIRSAPLPRPCPPAPSAAHPHAFAGLTSADRAVHEEILHRAYAIWESNGRPDNLQLHHWLEAEQEVVLQAASVK